MSYTDTSQGRKILEYLQAGGMLTPLDALNLFGCLRLGARIWDLRQAGHPITGERVKTNTGKFVEQYKIQGQTKLF